MASQALDDISDANIYNVLFHDDEEEEDMHVSHEEDNVSHEEDNAFFGDILFHYDDEEEEDMETVRNPAT